VYAFDPASRQLLTLDGAGGASRPNDAHAARLGRGARGG
jgi:hypothetical protein